MEEFKNEIQNIYNNNYEKLLDRSFELFGETVEDYFTGEHGEKLANLSYYSNEEECINKVPDLFLFNIHDFGYYHLSDKLLNFLDNNNFYDEINNEKLDSLILKIIKKQKK